MLVTVTAMEVGRSNLWIRKGVSRKRRLTSKEIKWETGMCTHLRKRMGMVTATRRKAVMGTAMVDTVTDILLTQRRVVTA
jgi:hypothetical protein